jgi:Xaa-Pro dipeptidase
MTASSHTRTETLDRIVASAELATVGQAALRHALAPGITEAELLAAVTNAIETANGGPVEFLVDLLSGERTALVDGGATDRAVAAGDPVLFDLAPRRDRHWADSCVTLACGTPSAELRRRHDAVRRALEAGIAAARPGATAGAVDAAVREALAAEGLECPHHSGHAVGERPQEEPFLNPGEPAVLEAGMAIAIEPGAYGGGFGVRLEHLVVIEADGARRITEHSLALT